MIESILADKSLKPSEKNEAIVALLLEGKLNEEELIAYSTGKKDPIQAFCMEALEFATRLNHTFGNEQVMHFAIEGLKAKTPRLKWESAKVVGNLAQRFQELSQHGLVPLLDNSEHSGTVVRWSAAFALSQIYLANPQKQVEWKPTFESIVAREEKNSIRKIYQKAL